MKCEGKYAYTCQFTITTLVLTTPEAEKILAYSCAYFWLSCAYSWLSCAFLRGSFLGVACDFALMGMVIDISIFLTQKHIMTGESKANEQYRPSSSHSKLLKLFQTLMMKRDTRVSCLICWILQRFTHHPVHRPHPNFICHEDHGASSGHCRAGKPHCKETLLIGMGGTGVSLSQVKIWSTQSIFLGLQRMDLGSTKNHWSLGKRRLHPFLHLPTTSGSPNFWSR